MLNLLDVNQYVKGLKPVTSMERFTKTQDFHEEGLFSELIFGAVGDNKRRKTFSYIELNAKVIHPSIFKLLTQLDRKVEKFLTTEESFSLDSKGVLQIDDDGVTGINEFIKLFPKINWKGETETRDKIIVFLKDSYKNNLLFIDKVPVIPPDARPVYQDEDGNWVIDALNDVYTTLMRRAYQVKSSGEGALFDLLNWSLQLAVNDHDSYIRTKIQKKSGIIRSQMLGKRVDFSGRAVITPGPKLKSDEMGVPFRMAIKLFEPFIIHHALYTKVVDKDLLEKLILEHTGQNLSVDAVKKVIISIKNGDKMKPELYDMFWDITENAVRGRVIVAKRDPVLHALSYRAYKPIIVHGNTMQLNTMSTGGHNADFDGDTMAIYHPITDEAQEEARTKMMRVVSPINAETLAPDLSKEMWVGLYTMTKDFKPTNSPIAVDVKDLTNANNPYIAVKYKGHTTTMGKAVFNSCFPQDYPFISEQANKKVVNKHLVIVFKKYKDEEVIKEVISRLEKQGFKFATIVGSSIKIHDIELPAEMYKLKEKLGKGSTDDDVKLIAKMKDMLQTHLKGTGLYDLVESGSTKGWDQPTQILIAKGIIADTDGNVLPTIGSSLSDGFNAEEYFNASPGARKGIIDRVLNTADTGYMSRKLAYVLNSVEADLQLRDCGVKKYLNLKLDADMEGRLAGRTVIKDGKLVLFDPADFRRGSVLQVRSPIYCKSKKVCHACYGRLLMSHKSPYIGIVAAQLIGERGTQLIMRSFHTGGAVKFIEKDIIQDIADNDPFVDQNVIRKYITQDNDVLTCTEDCKIIIDLMNYSMNKDITINHTEQKIIFKNLIAKVEFADTMFNIILDYPVELLMSDVKTIDKDYVELTYGKDFVFAKIPLEAQEIQAQVRYVERLLGGREMFKDVDHLYRKLLRVYGPHAKNMDSVHIEVLISNVLRHKKDLSIPARLGSSWDPVMINIKKIIFNSGFLQGLAFENINEAIRTGLITDVQNDTSILEKVLTGELAPKKKK